MARQSGTLFSFYFILNFHFLAFGDSFADSVTIPVPAAIYLRFSIRYRPFAAKENNGKKKRDWLYHRYDEKQHSIQDICELVAVAKSTLYSYLRERKAQSDP